MLNRLSIFALFFLFSVFASASLLEQPKELKNDDFSDGAMAEPDFLKVDEAFQFNSSQTESGINLSWDITDEYYLYKERFKFRSPVAGVEFGEPVFSTNGKAKQDPYFGEVHVIHHELDIFLPVTLPAGESDAEVKITYQGCAEAGLCYPPKHQYVLYIPEPPGSANTATNKTESVAPAAPATTLASSDFSRMDDATSVFQFIQNSSLPLIMGIFFLLGLGLTFTPCVFPMIPIMTSIIAGQSKPTVGKSLMLALAYVLGMAITYAAAGVITGLAGAGANVQAALQDPLLLSVFAGIFVLLALAMFGLYELQLPAFIRDRLNTTSQNLSGGHITSVFFIGALSALVVSPCVSAPLAGALLYISSTGDAVIGGTSLFALGMGMGVPLILIAIGGGKWLPKAGGWMDAVKAVFGVMLLAVAIWLLGRVIPAEASMILWALLIGVSGVQMGAFETAKYGWQRLWKAFGLIAAFYAALLIVGVSMGGTDPLKPLNQFTLTQASGATELKQTTFDFAKIYNINELNNELAAASDKPVMVDFYADWCISCKVMENQVFPLPDIASKLNQMKLVKADVTDNDQGNQELLNKFGLFGPPSILFFTPSGEELINLRIVGEIGPQAFADRLEQVLKR